MRVMCVEDERLVRLALRGMLARMGHIVCAEASSGEEALDLHEHANPDVVLMDIQLEGELDGIQTARSLNDRRPTPVVYLTAYTDDATRRRAMIDGSEFLVKPADFDSLSRALELAAESPPAPS